MAQKKGLISKRLGLPDEPRLTRKVCEQKLRILKRGLKEQKYDGKLEKYARYYLSWYTWRCSKLPRSDKKAA